MEKPKKKTMIKMGCGVTVIIPDKGYVSIHARSLSLTGGVNRWRVGRQIAQFCAESALGRYDEGRIDVVYVPTIPSLSHSSLIVASLILNKRQDWERILMALNKGKKRKK